MFDSPDFQRQTVIKIIKVSRVYILAAGTSCYAAIAAAGIRNFFNKRRRKGKFILDCIGCILRRMHEKKNII